MAVPQSFPAKIYQILENESSDIVQWNENGLSFRIVDHSRFEREIVPKYFRHNQISSVQRQLNLYGFKCISRGEYKRSFFHPKFKRGDWETVRKLTRYIPAKKSTGSGDREEGQPPASLPAPAGTAQAAPASTGSNMSGLVPFMYPYGPMSSGHAMHVGYPPNSGTSWTEPSWAHQTARTGGSSGGSSHGNYAMHAMHPVPGQPHGMPVYLTAAGTRTSDLSGRLGFAHWALPQGHAAFQQTNAPNNPSHCIAPQVKVPASAPAPPTESPEETSQPGSSLSVSPEDTPRSTGQAQVQMHEPSMPVNATANPDYDLMMEFGMFDSFPMPEQHSAATSAHLPVVQLPTPRVLPPVAEGQARFTTVSHPARLPGASVNTNAAALPVRSAPPSAANTPRAAATRANLGVKSAGVTQGKVGVDMACNTELTYDAATDSFVRRSDC